MDESYYINESILLSYFAGELPADRQKEVEEWIATSEENTKTARDIFQLYRAADTLNYMKHVDSVGAFHQVKDRIHKHQHRISWMVWGQRIAACLALPLLATTLYLILKNSPVEYVEIRTNPGMVAEANLPDGTKVWLNSGSSLKHPTRFTGDIRNVELDGEAYFEVAHNEKSPFVVHTSTLDVEVLGTKFNVEAYSARKIFETSLMEGRVKVKLPHDEKNSVILAPNQKTTLIDGRLVVSKIDDYNVYRWKEGLYCFRNKPFADIIKDLEKYYDLKIQMDKKEIAKVALTGKFRISDGLDYALRVLQNDVAFIYQRNRDNDVIHIK